MRADRTAITASVLLAMVAGGAAGQRDHVRRFRTQPQLRCGLPGDDYIHGNSPAIALAVSSPAVLVRSPGPPAMPAPAGSVAYAYYQLAQASVAVDHCAISRVVLTVWDNGAWSLDFRADQNPGGPINPPLILRGATTPTRFTAHIKRNLFTVRVRGFGSVSNPDVTLGRPVLYELSPPPFWVQRGVPLFPSFQGTDGRVRDAFWTVDRVEVELSYR
jgi:hypothetical protein